MHKIISALDLKIDLENANEQGLFKWLVASFLMGKRIQAQIAAEAYRVIVDKHQCDYEGIGPKTVEIFMREATRVILWDAKAMG